MWRAFDATGALKFPDFVETTVALIPMYWIRVVGCLLYLAGAGMLAVNMYMTWRNRPPKYDEPVHEAPALTREYKDPTPAPTTLHSNIDFARKGEIFLEGVWHRRWERLPVRFTIFVIIAVGVASLFEIIPTFLIRSNVPSIASVQPYTPLELAGRDIYIAEGCYNCHSQMVRPMRAETERYGEYSKPGEFIYDRPFQWGSRRIGPDLHRVGGKFSHDWHVRHFENPRQITQGSIMPRYDWLLEDEIDFEAVQRRVDVMAMRGGPYGEPVNRAPEMARTQADEIASELVEQGGYEGMADKKVIALVAYLQRLGTDIAKPAPTEQPADAAEAPATATTGGTTEEAAP